MSSKDNNLKKVKGVPFNSTVMNIEDSIHNIRGVQVLLDRDLTELYGVSVKRLNQQVKRNRERFPEDFMFQLSQKEIGLLRSQNATLEKQNAGEESDGRGKHRKLQPCLLKYS